MSKRLITRYVAVWLWPQFSLSNREISMAKNGNKYSFMTLIALTLSLSLSASLPFSAIKSNSSTVNSADYTVNCPAAHNAKRNINFSTKLIHVHTKRRRSFELSDRAPMSSRRRPSHLHCMCPETRAQH